MFKLFNNQKDLPLEERKTPTFDSSSESSDSIQQKGLPPNYANVVGAQGLSFTSFLYDRKQSDLSSASAIGLFRKVMPLFKAINLKATAASNIPIKVKDKRTNQFVESHPVLDLLDKPNADVSRSEFMKEIACYYETTGNAYLIATGRSNAEPLELLSASPAHATFGQRDYDYGFLNIPKYIEVDDGSEREKFKPDETQDKGLRFLSAGDDKEIWHIRDFNPAKKDGFFSGMSKNEPLWYELEQFVKSNQNNLAMLEKGFRADIAWVNTSGVALTDIQFDRLKEERDKYKGLDGVGATPILDGLDIKQISMSNKDMQFSELLASMYEKISVAHDIPLPLILSSAMTLNNLEIANAMLYDNAVFPLLDRILDELTRFLMPRYRNSENLCLAYSQKDVSALKARFVEMAEKKSKVGVYRLDEIREESGDEPLGEAQGGNQVLAPSNLVDVSEPASDEDDEDVTAEDI